MNVYVCIVVNEIITHAHKTTDIYAFKGGGYVYFNKILHVSSQNWTVSEFELWVLRRKPNGNEFG